MKLLLRRVGLLALFPLLVMCHREGRSQRVEINVYLGPEPSLVNWQSSSDLVSANIYYNLMEGLFAYEPSDDGLKVVPRLAQNFDHKNYQQWAFKIRKDIRWNNGDSLTSGDFIRAWTRLLSRKVASPQAHRLFVIKNAKAFNQGKVQTQELGIKKIDDYSFSVQLEHPFADFPSILTASFTFPIKRKNKTGEFTLDNLATLGPYEIKAKNTEDSLCMKPYPGYSGEVSSDRTLCLMWLEDEKTALRLFRKKQIDLVVNPHSRHLNKTEVAKNLVKTPGLGVQFFGFNLNQPPFDKKEERQAFLAGLEIREMKKLVKQDGESTSCFVPHALLNHKGEVLDKLAVTGPPPKDGRELLVVSNLGEPNLSLLENLGFQLNKKLGLKAQIRKMQPKNYFSFLREGKEYSMYRLTWTPANLEPAGYLELFHSGSKNNFSNYSDPQFDKLLSQARSEIDRKRQAHLYNKLERKLTSEDSVLVPLFNPFNSVLIRKNKIDFKPSATGRVEFRTLKTLEN